MIAQVPMVLWTIVALLVGAVAVMQFVGVRALESWGVRPSRAVIALRVFNLAVVIILLGVVFVQWSGR